MLFSWRLSSRRKHSLNWNSMSELGELKVLFPCPIQCCTHKNSNGPNSFRPKQKRPAESPILPATLILDKKQEKPNIVNKKSKNCSTPKAESFSIIVRVLLVSA
ncbi:hypothetical protein TNIN_332551 [Trichonephila inaurata madagascariensis]|uniref:Uncharacterized protein n=1 Tax=Trichonephila inaurata madagascariensis TaxID=2747483 RepID=A0A8X7C628_9ARAC|nr:hypothetical protein TNIN_332551 [Trichonephila inaurata madagascariensis]